MRCIIPRRAALHHAFNVIENRVNQQHDSRVARLYAERFGPLDTLAAELDRPTPTPAPITADAALSHLISAAGLPAAALCSHCWRDGYRTHGSKPTDRCHYFTPLKGI